MSRVVTIKTGTSSKVIEHRTEATTFSQLKNELPNVNFSNQKTLVKETNSVLTGDSSALPTGNFTMLVVPSNMKAGN